MPRKYGFSGCMPATVVSVEVSSGAGTSEALGIRRWPRSAKKARNSSRISSEVITVGEITDGDAGSLRSSGPRRRGSRSRRRGSRSRRRGERASPRPRRRPLPRDRRVSDDQLAVHQAGQLARSGTVGRHRQGQLQSALAPRAPCTEAAPGGGAGERGRSSGGEGRRRAASRCASRAARARADRDAAAVGVGRQHVERRAAADAQAAALADGEAVHAAVRADAPPGGVDQIARRARRARRGAPGTPRGRCRRGSRGPASRACRRPEAEPRARARAPRACAARRAGSAAARSDAGASAASM